MDDNKKYELMSNIWKPPHDYIYRQHVESGRHWRINSSYLDESSRKYYSWLRYSAYFDGVFCLPCVAFADHLGKTNLKKLYKEPFTRWNGAPIRWQEHNCSELHNFANTAMQTFLGQMEGRIKRINDIVNESMHKRIVENRKKLLPIMKTVVLWGQQNIALRGHRDDLRHIVDKSTTSGNFQALLDFRIDSGDEVLRHHFETGPKNATYRSKTIQNEIIACCGKLIQRNLIEETKQAKFFPLIADEATDCSNKELLAVVLRFVDKSGQIREEFIEFVHIHSCTGKNIAQQLRALLEKLGLDMNNLRGQGYDGAANMAGARSGASSIILSWCPKGLYFHCSGHRLNLVVAFTCKLPSVTNMMDAIRKCSQIFEFSAKKQGLLEGNTKAIIPEENKENLLNVCRTRWVQRLEGLERVHELFKPIIKTLEDIKDNHDGSFKADAGTDANGVHATFLSFDFVVNLIIVRHFSLYNSPHYKIAKVRNGH